MIASKFEPLGVSAILALGDNNYPSGEYDVYDVVVGKYYR